MNLIENHLYHVYNRGNDRQCIFLPITTISIFCGKYGRTYCRFAIYWLTV